MINVDQLRERIRERVTERDDYAQGECENCRATLTGADVEQGECSQCGSTIDDAEPDYNEADDDDPAEDDYYHARLWEVDKDSTGL